MINKLQRFGMIVSAVAGLLGAAEKPPQKPKDQKAPSAAPKVGIRTAGIQIAFARLKAEQEFAVLNGARWLAPTAEVVMAPGKAEGSLARLDARENKAGEPITGVGKLCGGGVEAFKSWWVADCATGTLVRIDGKEGKVTTRIANGGGGFPSGIAANADSIWVLSDAKSTLTRIDPDTNKIVSELRLPAGCNALAAGEGALWATCPADNRVLRINPVNNQIENRIEVSAQPSALTVGEGAVWVLCRKDGKVERIDPKTNKVVKTLELSVPDAEGAITAGGGSVWVTMTGFPLTRIDPAPDKERVAQQFSGEGGGAVQFAFGSVLLVNTKQGTLWKIDPKLIAATLAE